MGKLSFPPLVSENGERTEFLPGIAQELFHLVDLRRTTDSETVSPRVEMYGTEITQIDREAMEFVEIICAMAAPRCEERYGICRCDRYLESWP